MGCIFFWSTLNSGDHDQLKGDKFEITLCGRNLYSNICLTTSTGLTLGASESGLTVSLFCQCVVFYTFLDQNLEFRLRSEFFKKINYSKVNLLSPVFSGACIF